MVDQNKVNKFIKIRKLMQQYFTVYDYDGRLIDYEISENGMVDVDGGDVTMIHPAAQLPVTFSYVSGTFEAHNKGLTTLEGVPASCHNLLVNQNALTNLDHCPSDLNWLFVKANRLVNFEGSLRSVNLIDARKNPFKNLNGLENIRVEEIKISYSENLPLLKLLVAKQIYLAHDIVKLDHERVNDINNILQKYAGQGQKGALACAVELSDAGFKENAQW